MGLIHDALDNAADAGNARIENSFGRNAPATSGKTRVKGIRRIVLSFLSELPDDLTVFEIREALGTREE